MTSKRIEVAGLRSIGEMEDAIALRRGNVQRAEKFVSETFGEETLKWMTSLRGQSGGKPMFMLPRQIAKPDLQHAALYVMAERLGYGIVTLEWTNDFLSTGRDGYKRTYFDVPMGYVGRKGNLVMKNIRLVDSFADAVRTSDGKIRISDVEIAAPGVAQMVQQLERHMCAQLAASLEVRSYKIQELHSALRSRIEGPNQLSPDVSELGEKAAIEILGKGGHAPGLESVSYKRNGGSVTVDKVGGQFMNVLSFTLQNVAPNLVLSVTDWNGDDEIIRRRYETAVAFLRKNGLNEPLQFVMPSLHKQIGEPISGVELTQLDTIVPAKSMVCSKAEPKVSGGLGETFIEAGRSIIRSMKRPTPNPVSYI